MSSLIPRHQRLLITLMIVLLGGLPAGAEKLRPHDETARAPNFAAFKTRFVQAVKVRDVVWLESRITPHSHFGFGPNEQGISGFRARYRPEDPDSSLWRTLEKIMGTAGSYHPEEGMVCFPWLYRRLPTSEGESRAVILGDDVDVRAGPGAQTPVQERACPGTSWRSWDRRDPGCTSAARKVPCAAAGSTPTSSTRRWALGSDSCARTGAGGSSSWSRATEEGHPPPEKTEGPEFRLRAHFEVIAREPGPTSS